MSNIEKLIKQNPKKYGISKRTNSLTINKEEAIKDYKNTLNYIKKLLDINQNKK